MVIIITIVKGGVIMFNWRFGKSQKVREEMMVDITYVT